MDRRKTLAGLSPSHTNSRASMAPGRVMLEAKAAGTWAGSTKLPLDKSLARMSLAGPVQRRASTYVTTKAAPGLKADPRPLGDKAYQQNCIRTVITFLAAHGYEHQITPKVRA
jgi:kinetochore protein NDC80